jgi:hypothetical protein
MQFGINCATVGPQFDCAAECINNLSCGDLPTKGMACLQATCTDGGTGDGGAGDGGMMINACTACVGQNCLTGCAGNMTCLQWAMCANTCNSASPVTASCFQACDAMYASASSAYSQVYACACSMCGTQCAAGNPCAYGMDGGP